MTNVGGPVLLPSDGAVHNRGLVVDVGFWLFSVG
jgi:hypothetical protein